MFAVLALLCSFVFILRFSSHHPNKPSTPSFEDFKPQNQFQHNYTKPAPPPQTTEEEDVYSYNEVEEEDDGASFFDQIERANIAPIHLIGTVHELVPGCMLKSTSASSLSFPKNSIVLITEVEQDVYRGFIINSPLPENEQFAAQRALRIAKDEEEPRSSLDLTRVLFYGYGGPVNSHEHRWTAVHDNVNVPGATILGPSLAVGGDSAASLLQSSTRVLLLYGAAVWIPGQLEREITEGLWEIIPSTISSFDQVFHLCTSPLPSN